MDTGVLVSAALVPGSTPDRLVQACETGEIQLVVSLKLLAELQAVLVRHKFRRYISSSEAEEFVRYLRQMSELRIDPDEVPRVSADAGHAYLIALAHSSEADYLVSGDRHLTALRNMTPPVMTPAEFAKPVSETARSQANSRPLHAT